MLKLNWCFYTEGLAFHGGPIEDQSIGGSESALWYLSHELAERGHEVHVYCNGPAGRYGKVQYHERRSFVEMAPVGEWDVFVAHRFDQSHYMAGRARMNWTWVHDMPTSDEFFRNSVGHAMWKAEQLICLSKYHRDAYVALEPTIEPYIWLSKNGVDIDALRMPEGMQKKPGVLVYGSRPERGLWRLLTEIWPKLMEWRSDLHLVIAGYDTTGWNHGPAVLKFYDDCERAARTSPNVIMAGSLKKRQWWNLLREAEAVLYPTQFPEISCILALEAMAASTPIITTHDFALTETVPYKGVENPDAADYVERFIERTKEVLSNEVLYKSLQKQGRKHVEAYRWPMIAQQWEVQAQLMFEVRSVANRSKIFEQLVYQGDLVAARELAGRMEMQ